MENASSVFKRIDSGKGNLIQAYMLSSIYKANSPVVKLLSLPINHWAELNFLVQISLLVQCIFVNLEWVRSVCLSSLIQPYSIFLLHERRIGVNASAWVFRNCSVLQVCPHTSIFSARVLMLRLVFCMKRIVLAQRVKQTVQIGQTKDSAT